VHAKVRLLAEKIRASGHFVTYTGAGISTSSGIDDYASKGRSAAKGQASKAKKLAGGRVSALDAQPTLAHYTLAALHRVGHLKHWVQQNHDGLPQKVIALCRNRVHAAEAHSPPHAP
jgi:NAD-dependent SIR2 family protein deacetylase